MISNSKFPSPNASIHKNVTISRLDSAIPLSNRTEPARLPLKNPKLPKVAGTSSILQKSLLDWDSPSSSTGTIKRRPSPTTIACKPIAQNAKKSQPQHNKVTTVTTTKAAGESSQLPKSNGSKEALNTTDSTNLKGRTKNQITKTNIKLQKFNQNNKLQHQQQQKQQLKQQSKQQHPRSGAVGSKLPKQNAKQINTDNSVADVVNADDDDCNHRNDNNSSNETENPNAPRGIQLNGPKNEKKSTVKNSLCKQEKSNRLPMATSKAASKQFKRQNEQQQYIEDTYFNGEQNLSGSEVFCHPSIINSFEENPNETIDTEGNLIICRNNTQSRLETVPDSLHNDHNALERSKQTVKENPKSHLRSTVLPTQRTNNYHLVLKQQIHSPEPPPYRHPPNPPTPPPISQIPSLHKINVPNSSNEDKKSPSKNDLQQQQQKTPSHSPSKMPYHLSELKNRISKLNSKFSLTSALSRVHLTQSSGDVNEMKKTGSLIHLNSDQSIAKSNDYVICNGVSRVGRTLTAQKSPEDCKFGMQTAKFTSSQFKNIPVRQRKGPPKSHLENYCLFDPSVDFINEKDQKARPVLVVEANGPYNNTNTQTNEISSKLIEKNECIVKSNHHSPKLSGNSIVQCEKGQQAVNSNSEHAFKSEKHRSQNDNYFAIDPAAVLESHSNHTIASASIHQFASTEDNLQTLHVQQHHFDSHTADANEDGSDDQRQSTSNFAIAANKEKTILGSTASGIQTTHNKDISCEDKKAKQHTQHPGQQQSIYSPFGLASKCNITNDEKHFAPSQMNGNDISAYRKLLELNQQLPPYVTKNIEIPNDDNSINQLFHRQYSSGRQKNYNSADSAGQILGQHLPHASFQQITKLVENSNNIKSEPNKYLSTLKQNHCDGSKRTSSCIAINRKSQSPASNNNESSEQAINVQQHRHYSMDEIFNLSSATLSQHHTTLPIQYSSCCKLQPAVQGHSTYYMNGNNVSNSSSNRNNKNISTLGLHANKSLYCNKMRPLSSNSDIDLDYVDDDDVDSGFLSPNSFDELKFNSDIFGHKFQLMERMEYTKGYLEIYTDWANYYLERAKSIRRIADLTQDCCDGILLADIIETVTTFKVFNIVRIPQTHQEMLENVHACLQTLRINGIDGTEQLTAHDICSGNLKSILTLFFALSRYKQKLKQQIQQQKAKAAPSTFSTKSTQFDCRQTTTTTGAAQSQLIFNYQQSIQQIQQPLHQEHRSSLQQFFFVDDAFVVGEDMETLKSNWQKSVPYGKSNGTAIPLPSTVMVQRRCPPDKVRPLPPTPNHVPSIPGLGKTGNSGSSSLNSSPINSPHPHISLQSSPQKSNNNGLRPPQCKIPAIPFSSPKLSGLSSTISSTTSPSHTSTNIPISDKPPPLPAANPPPAPSKHSMLEKFKLFKTEKSSSSSNSSTKSERISSSSGFSSARSEKSDSSSSLNHVTTPSTKIKPPSKISSQSSDTSRTKDTAKKHVKQSSTSSSDKSSAKSVKEKSPAKLPNKDEKAATRAQKTTTKYSNGDAKQSAKSADSKAKVSEPRNGMVRSNSSNLSNSTSIPKPMAAIKGQTKNAHINSNEKSSSKGSQKDISKTGKDNGVITSHNSEQSKTHIVRPLPTHPLKQNGISIHNEITSCLNASPAINGILKKPDIGATKLNGTKNLATIDSNSQTVDEQNNINEATMPTTATSANRSPAKSQPNNCQNGDGYEEEQAVHITPMKPLLEGYNSHVTILPTRSNQKVQYLITEYTATGEIDIGPGYMSDGGESFRRVPVLSPRFLEIDNGYMSDGSVGSLGGLPGGHMSQQLAQHRGKHFLNGLRGRQLLPTTIIEERVRGSRGSLESIGTGTHPLNSPTSIQQTFIAANNNNINNINNNSIADISPSELNPQSSNNQTNSDSDSTNMESKCDSNASSRSSSRVGFINGRDNNNQKSATANGGTSEPNPNQKIKSSQKQTSSPSKTKGVPQSFGYIKRTNGSALGVVTTTSTTAEQQKLIHQQQQQMHQQQDPNRTALVSGVPRGEIPQVNPNRSFSLTGPGANQLSQAIRERLANGSYSLPKPGTEMHMFQHRVKYRHSGKILDGSLSDTQTYAEVKPEQSTYAMWLKHSNTASSRLSAGDSIESLQHVIGSPSMQRHSAHKLIHRSSPSSQIVNNGPQVIEGTFMQSPRLNRSNSIRSSKSDKMYSTLSSAQGDAESEPFYCLPVGSIQTQLQNGMVGGANLIRIAPWSQPTSPTPPSGRGGLLSPTHSGISSGYNSITPNPRLTYPKRNDDVHGSTASLLSGGSSLYGSVEERQAIEVRRLKRELVEAREQVMSLSSQLSTNAHVVSAFEQSLTNMKGRLHQLTETTERKDSELTDMRQTIELLRKQSIQAGLTSAHMQSMGLQSQTGSEQTTTSPRKQSGSESDQKKQTANGGTHLNTNRESSSSNMLEVQQQYTARGSICSLNSIGSTCSATTPDKKQKKKSWLKSSFTKAFSKNAKISKTDKHVSSIPNTPQKSAQQHRMSSDTNALQKQGWLGVDEQKNFNSPSHQAGHNHSKAPPSTPNKSTPQKCVTIIENAKPLDAIDLDGNPVVEDLKKQLREKDLILTDIRLEALTSASQLENLRDTVMKMRAEMLSLKQNNDRLQKLVTSRSLAGSEISLRNSISPNGSIISDSKRYSLVDGNRQPIELPKSLEEEVEEDCMPPAPAPEPPPPSTLALKTSPTTHIDLTPPPPAIEAPSPTRSQPPMLPTVSEDGQDVTDGKRIDIAVYLGQPESFTKYIEEIAGSVGSEVIYSNTVFHKDTKDDEIYSNATAELDERMYANPSLHEFCIACTYISGKTTWQNLDYIVRKTFKDYLARIDPGTNLGLNTDSITSYHLGEAKRGPEIGFPQLLPCGYIIGNVKTLYICLQGVGSLAFDSLIPRSIVHRYITLLTEHRRLILCGPSGTGKSYLARKLAEFIVARDGRNNISEAIATFNVDNKSSKELRQFLSYIGEQASTPNGESELPSVIILDNLHHASALGDVFSSLLSSGPAAKLPCIIGTMSQATCNTTNLQLHHNFRWVLTANHMEPVKGFLGRYLKRRLYTLDLHSPVHQTELTSVFAWLPTVWQHINRFLEVHSSSDVTIGPRLFLSCPLSLKDSQVWFTDIWNYHIVPYLIEAVREGVQLYGRRGGAWNDPSTFIRDTYPWKYGPDSVPPLRQINAEDVGLEGCEIGKSDSHDPLLNMLMHLQEAANYSEHQEPESDCVSLDSNMTQDSSVGVGDIEQTNTEA